MTGHRDDLGRRIAAEGILLAGGGAAILLQLAHPLVARGVAGYSDFTNAPLRRLEGTLNYVTAVVHGDDDDRRALRRIVNRRHARVPGAFDPEAQLWVAATLLRSAESSYARAFGRLTLAEREALRATFETIGTELQMPPGAWPASVAEFDAWWAARIAESHVSDNAKKVFAELCRPASAPRWLRVVLPIVWRVALAQLPARLRREFAPNWRRRDRFIAELFWVIVVPGYRMLPWHVRSWPMRRQLRALQRMIATAP